MQAACICIFDASFAKCVKKATSPQKVRKAASDLADDQADPLSGAAKQVEKIKAIRL